ncbi:MAG: hypothetical protein GY822_15420 [Deltaproteobacteria bacterium]|nr:hypothetical protein [Deltaproteobacteria bacterium]
MHFFSTPTNLLAAPKRLPQDSATSSHVDVSNCILRQTIVARIFASAFAFAFAFAFVFFVPSVLFAQDLDATPAESESSSAFELPSTDPSPLPFAGGSGDAVYICCAAGYCTYSAIDDCSLLSDSAKIVALSVAGVSGLLGFALGFAGGSMLLTNHDAYALTPLGGIALGDDAESVVALGFLGGAVGVLVGGVVGLFAGLITTPFFDEVSIWRPAERRQNPTPGREGAPPRISISQLGTLQLGTLQLGIEE